MVVISRNSIENSSACEQLLGIANQDANDEGIGYYANNEIQLINSSTNPNYQILDIHDRMVQSGLTSDNRIEIQNLAPAVYFLQIDGGILKFVHH